MEFKIKLVDLKRSRKLLEKLKTFTLSICLHASTPVVQPDSPQTVHFIFFPRVSFSITSNVNGSNGIYTFVYINLHEYCRLGWEIIV